MSDEKYDGYYVEVPLKKQLKALALLHTCFAIFVGAVVYSAYQTSGEIAHALLMGGLVTAVWGIATAVLYLRNRKQYFLTDVGKRQKWEAEYFKSQKNDPLLNAVVWCIEVVLDNWFVRYPVALCLLAVSGYVFSEAQRPFEYIGAASTALLALWLAREVSIISLFVGLIYAAYLGIVNFAEGISTSAAIIIGAIIIAIAINATRKK